MCCWRHRFTESKRKRVWRSQTFDQFEWKCVSMVDEMQIQWPHTWSRCANQCHRQNRYENISRLMKQTQKWSRTFQNSEKMKNAAPFLSGHRWRRRSQKIRRSSKDHGLENNGHSKRHDDEFPLSCPKKKAITMNLDDAATSMRLPSRTSTLWAGAAWRPSAPPPSSNCQFRPSIRFGKGKERRKGRVIWICRWIRPLHDPVSIYFCPSLPDCLSTNFCLCFVLTFQKLFKFLWPLNTGSSVR